MIVTGDWRQMVRDCQPDDLAHWHKAWPDLDWPTMLAQPGWHLITDGQGSWCLIEPHGATHMAHLIVSRHHRGRTGVRIARAMLDWIAGQGIVSLIATARERHTRLFLRWIGFDQIDDDTTMFKWSPPVMKH